MAAELGQACPVEPRGCLYILPCVLEHASRDPAVGDLPLLVGVPERPTGALQGVGLVGEGERQGPKIHETSIGALVLPTPAPRAPGEQAPPRIDRLHEHTDRILRILPVAGSVEPTLQPE